MVILSNTKTRKVQEMKFRVFTQICSCGSTRLIAVNVDRVVEVLHIQNDVNKIYLEGVGFIRVAEDFDTVVSRLNTIAE